MNKVHSIVTEKILASLTAGVVPWRKPWKPVAPRNYVSQKSYRGINRLLTELSPFSSPDWLTFKQITEAKGKLRKGSESTLITYYGKTVKKDDEDLSHWFLRYYLVFNLQQTEGITVAVEATPESLTVQAIIDGYANGPSFGGSPTSASYSPQSDRIDIPLPEAFEMPSAYARVLFHELIHSTGHPQRLNRFTIESRPSTEEYSFEELVAEIGAAMLMARSGLSDDIEQSAAYVSSWLERLKGDHSLVIKAASAAQKATDLILGGKSDEN